MTPPDEKKITITENGPYVISGNIPITEKIITPNGKGYIWTEGSPIPQNKNYALCRCGHSTDAPFCSGAHAKINFDGTELAGNSKYKNRAKLYVGPGLRMLDDDRCAFARFCHREDGTAWELLESSDNPHSRKEAIRAASECPAGRLTAVDSEGSLMEDDLEPEIVVIQDPTKKVSGGLYVKGGIKLVSSNGTEYETRNRYVLCRCGTSSLRPFCDGSHVDERYKDKI